MASLHHTGRQGPALMFADFARYLALEDRHRPRQRLRHWTPAAADFDAALAQRQFVPVFQIRVRPRDGALHSVQATVRWAHPSVVRWHRRPFCAKRNSAACWSRCPSG